MRPGLCVCGGGEGGPLGIFSKKKPDGVCELSERGDLIEKFFGYDFAASNGLEI